MKKYLYIILVALFAALPTMAQDVITGTVTEPFGNSDEPCMGVNVAFVNAQKRIVSGVVTDMNGMYTLKVPADAKNLSIQFSYIGMKTQTFKYTGQTTLDVKLEADNTLTQLTEVKVTGTRGSRNEMGVGQREMAFATQKINMAEILEDQAVTTIEEAIQGKLGGVDIISGGDPGAKSSIRIRGTATVSGSTDPLIVIDGVPYNGEVESGFANSNQSDEDFAAMLNLNPNDIESIEVRKDAASCAIYGSKGANGVIEITKKKGATSKTRFKFSTKNYIKTEPSAMPMLNGDQYTAYINDAIWNTANARGLTSASELLQLQSQFHEIDYVPEWRYFDEYNVNTDWRSKMEKTAFTTDNSFSMDGGGERANYRFSLGYTDEGGTQVGTHMKRLTTSFNVGYRFSEKVTVEAEYSYTDTKNDKPYDADVRAAANVKAPNKSPYYIGADGNPTDAYFTRQNSEEIQGAFKEGKYVSNNSYNYHPLIMAEESYNKTNTKEQKFIVRGAYFILPSLTYRAWVAMKFNTTKTDRWLPQAATGLDYGIIQQKEGNYSYIDQTYEANTNSFSLQTQNQLQFNKTFNEIHNLIVNGIWKTALSRKSGWNATRCGVGSSQLADVAYGSGYLVNQASSKTEETSLYGVVNATYTLMNRYTLMGTMTYEGNSSISPDNRWVLYPSIAASWQLQDEPFMKAAKEWGLSQAKIRASWGVTAASPSGCSPYIGTYTTQGYYLNGAAISANTMQLNNLKWQKSKEINLGTDISLWDGKVTASFDYYRKNTTDLLIPKVIMPASTGYAGALGGSAMAYTNSGALRNEGWEARADWQVLKKKNWKLSVNVNVSNNKNTIVELPSKYSEDSYSLGNQNYAQKLLAGTAIGSFFGYRYLGVYQNKQDTYAKDAEGNVMYDLDGNPIVMNNGNKFTCFPGDAKYEDINHDGVIDKNDIVYIGNSNPLLTGGGGFMLSYRDLSLTVNLHFRLGQKIINKSRMVAESMYNADNQSTAVLSRWRNEGDVTDMPRALWQYGYNQLGSDRYVEDCSYLRVKTVSLNYKLPKKFVQGLGLTSANVILSGQNLFTFTKYKGQEPEVSLPTNVTDIAMDNSKTPAARRYTLILNINF